MSNNLRASQPRYLLLAQQLTADIASGKFPVDSFLPTEMKLCEQYSASRYTIREAIRQLQSMGLVATRQGVGTQVVASAPSDEKGRFTSSFQSIEKLIQFAEQTQLLITEVNDIIADEALANQLSCKPGNGFLSIEALRVYNEGDSKPLLWLKAYVAAPYAGIRNQLGEHQGTISNIIEREYGIHIREIKQMVTPVNLDACMAEKLQVPQDTPALQIHRTYISDTNEIVEHAISIQTEGLSTTLTYEA